ncbi:cell division protein FtsQ/DivIB [Myroides sp. LJL119]
MKKVLRNIKWVDVRIWLICGIAFVLYSFANSRADAKAIDQVEVIFKNKDSYFVTSQEIRNDVEKNFLNTSVVYRTMLDLNKVEDMVLQNQLIRNAEVYLTLEGKLIVEVLQKQAIARLIDQNDSFYMDEYGHKMPLSRHFSKRVPMISGQIAPSLYLPLKQMLDAINKDDFLSSDITGIHIKPDESIVLHSRANEFDILFGPLDEISKKLNNYKAFVQYSLQDNISLNNYKTINLKFTQQVVCTK